MSCMVTIHLDPIDTHNPLLDQLKKTALQAVQSVDGRCSIHDVRLVSGPSHNNLIFDILVPHDLKMADEEIKTKVSAQIPDTVDGARIFTVIDVDPGLYRKKLNATPLPVVTVHKPAEAFLNNSPKTIFLS